MIMNIANEMHHMRITMNIEKKRTEVERWIFISTSTPGTTVPGGVNGRGETVGKKG